MHKKLLREWVNVHCFILFPLLFLPKQCDWSKKTRCPGAVFLIKDSCPAVRFVKWRNYKSAVSGIVCFLILLYFLIVELAVLQLSFLLKMKKQTCSSLHFTSLRNLFE